MDPKIKTVTNFGTAFKFRTRWTVFRNRPKKKPTWRQPKIDSESRFWTTAEIQGNTEIFRRGPRGYLWRHQKEITIRKYVSFSKSKTRDHWCDPAWMQELAALD